VLDQPQIFAERASAPLSESRRVERERLSWPSAALIIIIASALAWAAVAAVVSLIGLF
jgi:hypothetical protein